MGICSSSSRSSDSDNNGRSEREGLPQGDLPLSTDKPSWTTREPKTREEILRQQREFWDTTPMLEGRQEVSHMVLISDDYRLIARLYTNKTCSPESTDTACSLVVRFG
eukprot:TRINITY_DN9448_c0_g1_i10.p4 TRINITY_DN9448_c0_g1~~TRINITY_DN9448_c0_g1_i10.p4  ORF type:complete len:108 (+),score=9.61 TRINITY_DN9448_c0_g1_i10:1150-1473(+)